MSSIDSTVLKFMSGQPAIYKDICLVHSPFLRDIASEGLDKFYQYISLLLVEKPNDFKDEEIKKLLQPLSSFEYLLLLSQTDKEYGKLAHAAFEFFTKEKTSFIVSSPSIIFGDPSEKRILTKETFQGFQDLISLACAMRDPSESQIEFSEKDSPKVRELKQQLLEGRRKRERAKRNSRQGGKDKLELSDLIGSLAIGSNSLNMVNIWDLTYYAFQDQLRRLSWREEFDINTRASLAGAKLDKNKLSHWIKTMSFS